MRNTGKTTRRAPTKAIRSESRVKDNRVKIAVQEVTFQFVKSSGPGGQKVNKTNTKAELKWSLSNTRAFDAETIRSLKHKLKPHLTRMGNVKLQSDRFRSRGQNVSDCIQKLRKILDKALQPARKRKATKTPKSSKESRLEQKKRRSDVKRLRRGPEY